MTLTYGKYPSIEFLVEDKIYKVDKNILIGSDFFTIMFGDNFIERTMNRIEIEDINIYEWETMLEFVEYIYNESYVLFVTKTFDEYDVDIRENIHELIYKFDWIKIFILEKNMRRFSFNQFIKMFDNNSLSSKFSNDIDSNEFEQCAELLNILLDVNYSEDLFSQNSIELLRYILDELNDIQLLKLVIYLYENNYNYFQDFISNIIQSRRKKLLLFSKDKI